MRFRAVPERFVALTHRGITRADWESLDIPVGLAFVFTNSGLGRAVACYPSPAGATERVLSPGAWEDIVDRHPALAHVRADVEAVLVRLEGPEAAGRCASFIVPIDVCYELVGHLRRQWTGFDGGGEARRQIAALFDRIEGRAGPVDDGVLGD